MKRILVMGIVAVMIVSVFAGVAAASRAESKWGFKANVDLGDRLEPYLKVGYDALIAEWNDDLGRLNGSYGIDSHDCSMDGELNFAGAMKQDGNKVDFEIGNYMETNMEFTASGTFPAADTVVDFQNNTYYPKKMDSQLSIEYRHKIVTEGSAITDGNGNVSSVETNAEFEMYIHVKGKNVPIPLFLYAALYGESVEFGWIDGVVYFNDPQVTDNSICFTVEVNNYGDEPVKFRIDNFSISVPGYTVTVDDTNGNGYLDDGEHLCINGDVNQLATFLANGNSVYVNFTDDRGRVHSSNLHNWPFAGWDLGYIEVSYFYERINPKFSDLLNDSKDLPPYDDFDFYVTVSVSYHTLTEYSPALPMLPKESMEVNYTTNGTYVGEINIEGLQDKYMRIVEALLNQTFPIKLEEIDTGNSEMNYGHINASGTMYVSQANIIGTKEYGGETVYVVSLTATEENLGRSATRAYGGGSVYYYYSPSKNFIVGGGVKVGEILQINTEATSYEEASDEINEIKSKDVAGTITFAFLGLISLAIIVGVLLVAVIITLHHKKSKAKMGENQ